jgi:hypothetical protein
MCRKVPKVPKSAYHDKNVAAEETVPRIVRMEDLSSIDKNRPVGACDKDLAVTELRTDSKHI